MKTLSNEGSPRMIARLLTSAFLACLIVAAVCVVALPGSAVGPAGDAQKAYDEWVAANEAAKEAKKNAQDAKDKLANIMAVSLTGGITEGEERALAKARDEVAKAEAALKDAEARLEAARIALEKAIAELEDEKLKKELIRKRDGYLAAQRFTAMAPAKASVETKSGLQIVTFDTSHGRVIVNLPDDTRAGDTISGTVVTEPKGNTEQEKTANDSRLKIHVIQLDDNTKVEAARPQFKWTPQLPTPPAPVRYVVRLFEVLGGSQTEVSNVPLLLVPVPVEPMGKIPSTLGTSNFVIPPLGQSGRPIVIPGPFDGDSSNTTLRYGPADRMVHEFVKQSDSVSDGFGLLRTLAESPRKIVFESPTNVTGPMGIMVKEGDGPPTMGTYRNVGVNLSAPKTNLMRGERTTLTVEVRGLEGIKEDAPLQLDSKGVITMEGGNFQNLRIRPQEVQPGGRYTTTRAITGQQAGAFTVTATVIVRRFDFGLQDDTDPNRLFHFNSFTGDYIFACGGGSCRRGTGGTSGQPPTGSSAPPPVTLTGTGKPAMKGCIITLSHNAPDRRVFAKLDVCTKSADASVETTSPQTKIKITDKNTTDNTATSPPPK